MTDYRKSNGADGSIPKLENDPGVVVTPPVDGEWTVQKVVSTIPTGAPTENSPSPVSYFHLLERLKTTKREGWRRFAIERGESIADHMYRMSLLSMLAPPSLAPRLDLNKCIKMCLIHDMAEALVGDITPVDGVPKKEKNRREAATMDYITQNILGKVPGADGEGSAGREIRAVWQEYEDSQTLESKYVHDIDKMELLLQMVEYEKRGGGQLDLGEFAYVATCVVLPEVQVWSKEVLKEREEFWAGRAHERGDLNVEEAKNVEGKKEYYDQK